MRERLLIACSRSSDSAKHGLCQNQKESFQFHPHVDDAAPRRDSLPDFDRANHIGTFSDRVFRFAFGPLIMRG